MSETDIANLSLGRLAIGQAIASLVEQSTPARLCNRFYDFCRKTVLRAHPWGFATSAVQLAQVAGQTFPGWQYVYQYPDDCLMVHAIGDESGLRYMQSVLLRCDWREWYELRRKRQPFQIALKADGASRVILSDVPNAWSFHTADVTNTGVFPSDFEDVFAWRLAMEVGGPLQASASLVERAHQQYLFWHSHATAQDMNERSEDERPDSPSIACRN